MLENNRDWSISIRASKSINTYEEGSETMHVASRTDEDIVQTTTIGISD